MNCDQINEMLDLMLDGALTDEQRAAMEAHGRECPACAAAIRQATQLKALFSDMEPEVDVPLEAQAGWRNAVRKAAGQRRRARLYRWLGTVAAVAVLGVGIMLGLRGMPVRNAAISAVEQSVRSEEASLPLETREPVAAPEGAMPERAAADEAPMEGAVIESDGGVVAAAGAMDAGAAEEVAVEEADFEEAAMPEEDMEEADSEEDTVYFAEEAPVCAAAKQRGPACEIRLRVASVENACDLIRDLASEYEGSAEIQSLEDGGANAYVEIAAQYAADFISAIQPMHTGDEALEAPALSEEGTVLMLLALSPGA